MSDLSAKASADVLVRARAFAEPFLSGESLDTGENMLAHADAVVAILDSMNSGDDVKAATYLVYACPHLSRPQEVIAKTFGNEFASLAVETTKLEEVQKMSRSASSAAQLQDNPRAQTENVRKMLLAFSKDLRVIMLRLASRLQTLRYFASVKKEVPALWPKSLCKCLRLGQSLGHLGNQVGIGRSVFSIFRARYVQTHCQTARRKACRAREQHAAFA